MKWTLAATIWIFVFQIYGYKIEESTCDFRSPSLLISNAKEGNVLSADDRAYIMAKRFARRLSKKGINQILEMQVLSDHQVILWSDSGVGYLKLYVQKGNKVEKKKIIEVELAAIQEFFKKHGIQLDRSTPKSQILSSHHGRWIRIQYQYGDEFYEEALPHKNWEEDPNHIKSIWISMILKEMRKALY